MTFEANMSYYAKYYTYVTKYVIIKRENNNTLDFHLRNG
jgi:hypothetical protein